MRVRTVVTAAILTLLAGGAFVDVKAQDKPAETLPPAGGGPAAAAAYKAYETSWDKLPQGERGEGVPAFYVREGYKVTVASDPIPNGQRQGRNGPAGNQARFLALDNFGTVYVSQPCDNVQNASAGRIVAMQDKTGTGKYEMVATFVDQKHFAHAMCFKDGWLWFATDTAVYKGKVSKDGKMDGELVTMVEGLPGGGHWWKGLLVTEDGFFVSIGDEGNADDGTDTPREKIWKYSLDGKTKTLWCSGVRNTEKLAFRPGTTELWGCDHGSDNFGGNLHENGQNQPVTDTFPPDEFNHYVKDGFYGHPFVIGTRVPRAEYSKRADILTLVANTIPPAWEVGPHFANCGWAFATRDTGVAHKSDALIACHGSWNSTMKRGYRIQKVCFDQVMGLPYGAIELVGTLSADHKQTLGRPVDVLELPDGSFLFSDDQNNRLYHLQAAAGRTEPK